jgi:hypothetical protein
MSYVNISLDENEYLWIISLHLNFSQHASTSDIQNIVIGLAQLLENPVNTWIDYRIKSLDVSFDHVKLVFLSSFNSVDVVYSSLFEVPPGMEVFALKVRYMSYILAKINGIFPINPTGLPPLEFQSFISFPDEFLIK